MTPRILSRRTLCSLAFLLALAAAMVTLAPATTEADRCGNYFHYYSDATYTTPVGGRFYECNCQLNSWGTISFYRIIEPLDC